MTTLRKLGLKLFSIALAVGLWLAVSGEPIAERGMRVPLAFENLPESMEILGDPPQSVDVRLRGSTGTLRRLDARDMVATIDLESERAGARMFDMTSDRVRVPLGIEVTQVAPSTISLIWRRRQAGWCRSSRRSGGRRPPASSWASWRSSRPPSRSRVRRAGCML